MLLIRNLEGLEEFLIDFKGLKRSRKINGEKTISLTTLRSKGNEFAFDLVEEESIITFGDDEYVIKVMSERSIGNTSVKQVEAIHKFYVDMINKQQPTIHNGSITFQNYMNLVFEDTGYSFIVIDSFLARSFENLGDDNRLSLLKKGLDRFKAEMELVGNQVRFRQQVGNDTDFQFRYGHNIKTIERNVDTTNLATVIKGKGDPELGIEEYHESPNVTIFGKIDAPSVSDERFKSKEALLDEMKARLQDTPEFSVTISFIDLRAAGYPYTVPNEGDSVFVIYEPMKDLLIDTRILEIEETFNVKLDPIKTDVTLANYKKSFAGTMFDNVQKQLDGIVNDDGVIRYNVLDEAVRIATEALKSAQTELIFDNGIIARDKNNPNRVVVYNSEGIGISDDGGQTFREAVTADGFVLTAGAIGRLSANHIQIGPDTDYKPGYDPTDIKESLKEFEDYVGNAFHDGIIEEAEAKAIEKYLNTLEVESESLSKQVGELLNSEYIGGFFQQLLAAYSNYGQKYTSLKNSINDAIADGKTTPSEKNNVDNKFTSYKEALKTLVENIEKGIDEVSKNRIKETDDIIRDNLNITAPLPTSISMDNYGITASTSFYNKYARLDYRGLYIAGGAIQIDDGLPDNQIENSSKWNRQGTYIDQYGIYTGKVSANQVSVGFNDIGSSVKISSAGLSTYRGGLRTSLLDGSGQRFYDEGTYTGHIGASSWVNDDNYKGLRFGLENSADYMSWGFKESANANSYTTMLSWHKTSAKSNKGFNFSDHINIGSNYNLYVRTLSTANYSSGNRHLQLQNYTWNGLDGVAIRRASSGGKLFLHSTRAALMDNDNAYIEVSSDSTGNRVHSMDIWNRTYSGSSNAYITSAGTLGHSTSSERYKINIENQFSNEKDQLEHSINLLNLDIVKWNDKTESETYAEEISQEKTLCDDKFKIEKYVGLTSERVVAAGFPEHVQKSEDGLEGIEYDRLWVHLIPIVKNQQKEIQQLKSIVGVE